MYCNIVCCDGVIIFVYCYNDCGCGIVVLELVIMVGVDCVEGCVFGNGECIGNVDVVVIVLNMYF